MTPYKFKQFANLSEHDKLKVESILVLMDKFAVGVAFIHELCMVVDGMPKSYLMKQCSDLRLLKAWVGQYMLSTRHFLELVHLISLVVTLVFPSLL